MTRTPGSTEERRGRPSPNARENLGTARGPRPATRGESRKPTRSRGWTECLRGESKGTGPGRRCRPCQIIGLGAAPASRLGSDGDATPGSGARPNALCRVQARLKGGTADATTTDHVDPNCRVLYPAAFSARRAVPRFATNDTKTAALNCRGLPDALVPLRSA